VAGSPDARRAPQEAEKVNAAIRRRPLPRSRKQLPPALAEKAQP